MSDAIKDVNRDVLEPSQRIQPAVHLPKSSPQTPHWSERVTAFLSQMKAMFKKPPVAKPLKTSREKQAAKKISRIANSTVEPLRRDTLKQEMDAFRMKAVHLLRAHSSEASLEELKVAPIAWEQTASDVIQLVQTVHVSNEVIQLKGTFKRYAQNEPSIPLSFQLTVLPKIMALESPPSTL